MTLDDVLPSKRLYSAAHNRHRAAMDDPRTTEQARRAHRVAAVITARAMVAELDEVLAAATDPRAR